MIIHSMYQSVIPVTTVYGVMPWLLMLLLHQLVDCWIPIKRLLTNVQLVYNYNGL